MRILLDFRKVRRTISSSGSGASKLAGASGARPTRFILFISGVFALSNQFFIVPIYRAITKNISESTCGKSNILHTVLPLFSRDNLVSKIMPNARTTPRADGYSECEYSKGNW